MILGINKTTSFIDVLRDNPFRCGGSFGFFIMNYFKYVNTLSVS